MSLMKSSRFLISNILNNKLLIKKQFSAACPRLSDLKFSEKHEWIKVNGNVGTIGITDYAQVIYNTLNEKNFHIDK